MICAWSRYDFATDRAEALRVARKASRKLLMSAVSKCFNRWQQFTDEQIYFMNAIRKVARNWMRMELAQSFRKWEEWWEQIDEQRQVLSRAAARLVHRRMFGLWLLWRQVGINRASIEHQ